MPVAVLVGHSDGLLICGRTEVVHGCNGNKL